MTDLALDFETRSTVDLKKTGSARYARDESTDVWCAAFAFGDEEPDIWTPADPAPERLVDHIRSGGVIRAFNAQFERDIFTHIMGPRYGWPVPEIGQYRCTMVRALAMALPGGLDDGTKAIGLSIEKDMEGHRLMQRMARPRKIDKETGAITWWTEPEKMERLFAYCKQDVIVERLYAEKLFQLSGYEQEVWELDQLINSRGVHIDTEAALAAMDVVDAEKADLDRRMDALTDGKVSKCSKVGELKEWVNFLWAKRDGDGPDFDGCLARTVIPRTAVGAGLWLEAPDVAAARVDKMREDAARELALTEFWARRKASGKHIDSLAKDKLEALLRTDLPDEVRTALDLRQQAGKSSTAKLQAMLNRVDEDSRARNCFQYSAASTRRWGGRGIQTQNMPRPVGIFEKYDNVDAAIEAMAYRDPAVIWAFFGPPQDVISNCLRGFITAAPGNTLVAADFESVEGAGLAWAAGENWKLQAFQDYFDGKGPKLYNVTAAKIFGCPVEEIGKGHKYQIGKVSELALGYAGGVGAFVSMGANYRMDAAILADAYPTVLASTPPENVDGAEDMYKREKGNTDLPKEAWLACDMIKRNWRDGHPATVKLWADLEVAAEAAVRNPGDAFSNGTPFTYRVVGSFLWCKLPSGGVLAYPFPQIKRVKTRWKDDKGRPVYKETVTAMWVNSTTKKWERRSLYSGLYTENVIQAICRDLLAASMLRAERAGWPIVMHVHDELVAELPTSLFHDKGGSAEFERLVAEKDDWAAGFPLKAAGWAGKRYRKD